MIKKYDMINPNTIISVTIPEDDMIDDEYIYLCKLITKESVLLPYHPLLQIKQFIEVGFAVTEFVDEDNERNFVSIEKVMVYIDYYGFERTEIKDRSSKNTIIKVFETYIKASLWIQKQELKNITDIARGV